MIVVAILILLLTGYGILEFAFHFRNLRAIPLRIHVNGTRGKSSVTRLIAAGLRAGGVRAIAKTTGTAPRVILEDGSESRIYRPGSANIIEQLKFMSSARARSAQAIVIECMALQPDLQWLTERKMVRSHVGVITNVRSDHLDVMGPSIEHVAAALSNTIPYGMRLYTAESNPEILEMLEKVCSARKTRMIRALEDEVEPDMLRGFSYIEHRENISLALKVCEDCGIDRATALKGMVQAIPDPGVLRIYQVKFFDKDIQFFNVLAANDPDSTVLIWKRVLSMIEPDRTKIIVLNSRADRIQRSEQMGVLIARDLHADVYILAGEYTRVIADEAVRLGRDEGLIEDLGGLSAAEIFESVLDHTVQKSMVFAIGNIGGMGQQIVDYFKHRGGALDRAGDWAGARIEPYIF